MLPKFDLKKEKLAIMYKLLADALFILSGFLLAAISAEILMPGISTAHSAFTTIIFLMALNIMALHHLSKKNEPLTNRVENRNLKKPALILVSGLLVIIFLSLWKLSLILSLMLTAFMAATGALIYKAFEEE